MPMHLYLRLVSPIHLIRQVFPVFGRKWDQRIDRGRILPYSSGMTECEIRLECLKLASTRGDPREAVKLAGEFAEFVLSSNRVRHLLPSNSEDTLTAANQHQQSP